MLAKNNGFFQKRRQNLCEREISRVLLKIVQENDLPFFSLSHCVLSTRGENLKVYLTFPQEENKEKLLMLMNKKYSPLVKKEIAKSKKFSYIPAIFFLLDKELERINTVKKIIQKLNVKDR